MALVKCRECKREISSKASSCPYCGAPTRIGREPKPVRVRVMDGVKIAFGMFILFPILVVLATVLLGAFILIIGELSKMDYPNSSLQSSSWSFPTPVPTPNPLKNLSVEDLNFFSRRGFIYVTGRIRNDGDVPVSYVRMKFIYGDEEKNVIDTDWAYVVGSVPLLPGEAKEFEQVRMDSDKIKRVSVRFLPN